MKIMVIIAHPNLAQSQVNKAFAHALEGQAEITVRDLYREYPNWEIDVAREQQLLLEYDRIVFQFPFYWYSCPPLLKKWFDDVMTYGWAFGKEGVHLKGKQFMLATTTGGAEHGYHAGGDNWYTIDELLRPIQVTLLRCNGTFLPTFVTYDTTYATADYIAEEATRYAESIQAPLRLSRYSS
ncbi:general stress protein [Paenibacillus sp. H1-7]|uniref:NAD(P)H-dependent oxidoreductase n=1 Tax=Paenibacillus sp. H1-7 TaxID=2282849 RepID=UPI001EF7AB86|nr:NAD(P)H-dependent oxidoreductase [Paenibacillus sp. H1-7]ULL13110.1 general stress protein [Paenibacillus sp. H1-7]